MARRLLGRDIVTGPVIKAVFIAKSYGMAFIFQALESENGQ